MLQYIIKITELAEQDLENVGDYIAYELCSPDTAVRLVRGIRMEAGTLQTFPESHELVSDPLLAEMGVRWIHFKEYNIFYTIDYDAQSVVVVRILHQLVDSKTWLYETFGIVAEPVAEYHGSQAQ